MWKSRDLAHIGCKGAEEGAQFGTVFFRNVTQADGTGVDAVCTYRKEPSDPTLDRVGLFHQVSNKTRGITQMGSYSLDKDSLYVNGDLRSSLQPSPARTITRLQPLTLSQSLPLFSQVTMNSRSCLVSTLPERAGLRRHQVLQRALLLGRGHHRAGLVILGRSREPNRSPLIPWPGMRVLGRRPLHLPCRALTSLISHFVTPHLCFLQLPAKHQRQLQPSSVSPSTSPSPISPTILT